MTRRGLGLLLLLSLGVIVGAIIQDVRFESWIAHDRQSAANIDRAFGDLAIDVADLRAAETAYVATGQDATYWIKHAGELSTTIDTGLTRLHAQADAAGRQHLDGAAAALGNLTAADRKARDYVSTDQRYLASDVIFMDIFEASRHLESELNGARSAAWSAATAKLIRISQWRIGMQAGALAFVFLVAYIGFRRVVARETAPVEPPVESAVESELVLVPVEPAPLAPPPPAATAPNAEPSSINLNDVADLCVDLGRVQNSRDMPALIGRAADVLDAKGLVLWVIDTSGAFLRPLLAHGYSEAVMQRLGGLQIDANNVTSLAYRTGLPQVMNATSPGAAGAIAVPVVTSARCIGVLAAEIKRARPQAGSVAAARLIAAQLAALAVPAEGGTTESPAAKPVIAGD